MILKLLLVIGVIAVVYFMFIKKKPSVSQKSKASEKKEELQSNDMIECCECGVYCEVDEMILSNNKYYCSKECIDKAS